MRKPALYSRSSRVSGASPPSPVPAHDTAVPAAAAPAAPRTPRRLWRLTGLLGLLGLVALLIGLLLPPFPVARKLSQKDIDAAVLRTLETASLPSPAARAYRFVEPSVVRVMGYGRGKDDKDEIERGVGSGVVIVDKGLILTNLHVVQAAERIEVIFSGGLESGASIVGVQPENDLAVLQAHKIPDDLVAATMRSTGDLAPGDQVMAVGYPFGIGPSASAGVVSGLKRSFRSPEGKQQMNNLIQFDAAANPGNSGGPLVTMEGHVVGIVTAILNPSQQRTFIGIGFAVPIENAASAAGLPPF